MRSLVGAPQAVPPPPLLLPSGQKGPTKDVLALRLGFGQLGIPKRRFGSAQGDPRLLDHVAAESHSQRRPRSSEAACDNGPAFRHPIIPLSCEKHLRGQQPPFPSFSKQKDETSVRALKGALGKADAATFERRSPSRPRRWLCSAAGLSPVSVSERRPFPFITGEGSAVGLLNGDRVQLPEESCV